jgi:hypothetical protein
MDKDEDTYTFLLNYNSIEDSEHETSSTSTESSLTPTQYQNKENCCCTIL